MPTIYNATHGDITLANMPTARMRPFNDVGGDQVLDFSLDIPALRPDFKQILLSLPDEKTAFDIEPSSSPYLDYRKNPDTAVSIRQGITDFVLEHRPGLDFGFYTLPGAARRTVKDPAENAVSEIEREVSYMPVGAGMPSLFIPGYWKAKANEESYFPEWRAQLDMQVAMSTAIHGKLPHVFVWHNAKGWGSVSYSIMMRILKYCRVRDLPVVIWSRRNNPYPIPWWILLAYWQHSIL